VRNAISTVCINIATQIEAKYHDVLTHVATGTIRRSKEASRRSETKALAEQDQYATGTMTSRARKTYALQHSSAAQLRSQPLRRTYLKYCGFRGDRERSSSKYCGGSHTGGVGRRELLPSAPGVDSCQSAPGVDSCQFSQ
jgi:hypothetical protein